MDELTYILGAGASYQSIPIVRTFANRFSQFSIFLKSIHQNSEFINEKREVFRISSELADKLYIEFENSSSPRFVSPRTECCLIKAGINY